MPPPENGSADIGVTRAARINCCKLFLMFCNKLADGRDKIVGNLHDGVVLFGEGRLILGHRFFRRLLLIVGEDAPNSLFVPSGGKSTLAHIGLPRCGSRVSPCFGLYILAIASDTRYRGGLVGVAMRCRSADGLLIGSSLWHFQIVASPPSRLRGGRGRYVRIRNREPR